VVRGSLVFKIFVLRIVVFKNGFTRFTILGPFLQIINGNGLILMTIIFK